MLIKRMIVTSGGTTSSTTTGNSSGEVTTFRVTDSTAPRRARNTSNPVDSTVDTPDSTIATPDSAQNSLPTTDDQMIPNTSSTVPQATPTDSSSPPSPATKSTKSKIPTKQYSSQSNNSRDSTALIGGIVGAVVFLSLLVMVYMLWRRRQRKLDDLKNENQKIKSYVSVSSSKAFRSTQLSNEIRDSIASICPEVPTIKRNLNTIHSRPTTNLVDLSTNSQVSSRAVSYEYYDERTSNVL